ncbi:MAG: hypothetical protein ACFFCI_12890 [Promethearchaeota archaeon]
MSSSFKVKVVAAGWNPVKSAFFKGCKQNLNNFCKSSFITLGTDIKTTSRSNEYGDSITISIWDINSAQRFRFMSSTFFRGAVACLLFYDVSVSQSFTDLNYWIEQIRSNSGHIPIFLIAFKSDIKDKINLEDLRDFVESNEISRFYHFSKHKELKITQIFDNVVLSIFEHIVYYRPENLKLSDQEKQLYRTFLLYFSRCPICSGKNHISNLNKVFFSNDPFTKRLKENLVELMEDSEFFDELLVGKIKIGIPCCSCFKKVFSKES